MDASKTSVIALAVAAAVSATSEPAATFTDPCAAPGTRACAPEPGTPVDQSEFDLRPAVVERQRTEQAPPPAPVPMPPGRGTQWMFDQADRPHYDALFAMDSKMRRNAAVLDVPQEVSTPNAQEKREGQPE